MSAYEGKRILDLFSKYAINRNNFIAKLIAMQVEDDGQEKKVLEFGSGMGEFIDRFTDKKNLTTYAVESDEEYFQLLSKKHNAFRTIDQSPGDLDLIFLIDVLEHVEDDRNLLKSFYEKIKPGGRLFIYVPARQELFSDYDKSIGHYRRYEKKELKEKVIAAGFTVERCQYHEMAGYAATYLHNVILNKKEPSSSGLSAYDKILPISNQFEKFISPPIGKSLYLAAKKDNLG